MSPRPAPAPDRARSLRKNGSKIRGRSSGAIPSPVSSTASASRSPRRSAESRTVPSAGVWRTAFTSRFCRTRATLGEQSASAAAPRSAREGEPLRVGLRLDRRERRGHQVVEPCPPGLGLDRAGLQLGELEEIVDEVGQLGRGAPHLADVACHRRRIAHDAVVERLDHRPQARQRRPQVVGDGGHQVAAGLLDGALAGLRGRQLGRPCRPGSRRARRGRGLPRAAPTRASRSPSPSARAVVGEVGDGRRSCRARSRARPRVRPRGCSRGG